MTIKKNEIVTLKNGRQFKVVRISKTHVDLQKAELAHLPTMVTGYTSYPVRGPESIWKVIA